MWNANHSGKAKHPATDQVNISQPRGWHFRYQEKCYEIEDAVAQSLNQFSRATPTSSSTSRLISKKDNVQ